VEKELKLEIKKADSRELIIKVFGETHTLGNLLAKSALRHPNVKLAAYSIEHPLEEAFVLRIVTDGSRPANKVLMEIVEGLIKLSDEVVQEFRSALER
jgi:DNA-directed RNA polymerase subunit L